MLTSIHNLAKFRKGMTLVELLIAMSIMVMMAAITAAFYPSISSDNQISNTANKIQSTLVGARQVAMRTRQVTGVRFLTDTNNPNVSTQMLLVQKPVDLIGYSMGAMIWQPLPTGVNPLEVSPVQPSTNILSFGISGSNPVSPTPYQVWGFANAEDLVGSNDILVDLGTNRSTRIKGNGFVANPPNVKNTNTNVVLIDSGFYNPQYNLPNPSTNFKIIRQPRPIPGEEPISLSDGYEVILKATTAQTAIGYKDIFPSIYKDPVGAPSAVPPVMPDYTVDFGFEKTGALYQPNFSSNVYIWLHKSDSTNPDDDAIIGINRLNGKVGVFPVSVGGTDPFAFAKDLKNEGL
jgi:prepilin-type N-terminal cleavage/methylation domain-containing protein